MPTPNPTRPYSIPGFRIALVREPGVKLAERPELRSPVEAVPTLAQYIGETDREVFAVALLTVRHPATRSPRRRTSSSRAASRPPASSSGSRSSTTS